jgi:hypothetical protein
MFETINVLDTEPAEGGNSAHEYLAEPNGFGVIPRMTAGSAGKILLPRRSGESRFGPRQYYYPTSRTGVVPGWAASSIGA